MENVDKRIYRANQLLIAASILLFLVTMAQWVNAQAPFNTPDNIGAGNCLDFDGIDDIVGDIGQLNSYSFIQNTAVFSLETWIQQDNTYSISTILGNTPTSAENGFDFRMMDNVWGMNRFLNITIWRGDGTRVLTAVTPQNIVTDDLWHHVAVVGNGTTVTFYIDGNAFVGEPVTIYGPNSHIVSGFPMGNSTRLLRIGDDYSNDPPFNSGSQTFNGTIDEVRIWNVARTHAQIRDDMCRQLTGTEPGLVGYWNMNEGTGNTVNDLTPNANHGTRQ